MSAPKGVRSIAVAVLGWVLQQVGVPVVWFLVMLLELWFVRPLLPVSSSGRLSRAIYVACLFSISAITGYVLGRIVLRFVPKARPSGKLVWILPTLGLIVAFVKTASRTSAVASLRDFVFPETHFFLPYLTVLFFTCPTVAMISYSAALTWRCGAPASQRPKVNPTITEV